MIQRIHKTLYGTQPVNARLVSSESVQLTQELSVEFPLVQVFHAIEVHIRNLQEHLHQHINTGPKM